MPLALKTLGVIHGMVENLRRQRRNVPVLGAVYAGIARAAGPVNSLLSLASSLLFPTNHALKALVAILVLMTLGWRAGTFISARDNRGCDQARSTGSGGLDGLYGSDGLWILLPVKLASFRVLVLATFTSWGWSLCNRS